jgi:uncharacterized protein
MHRDGSIARYDVIAERDVMIRARDGVGLATDLYLPAVDAACADGRFPVLVERTPYDKRSLLPVRAAKFFAAHGYAVALQDVRGRFGSEGDWYPFADEAEDGYDTVAWLAQQPWCDGQVGTIGHSYSGSDQHALASLRPPGLAAMVVTEGMVDYHTSAMRQGGALELRFLVYAFKMAWDSPAALADPELRAAVKHEWDRVSDWLGRLPLRPDTTVLHRFPGIERWVLDIQAHAGYDGYWRKRGYSLEAHLDEHADVPVLLIGGWYDSYARSTTDSYLLLSRRLRSPVRLIMGPWIHGVAQLEQSWAGDAELGPDAPIDYNRERLRFFDEALKGLDVGLLQEPTVRGFLMGGGSGRRSTEGRLQHGGYWWRSGDWPPPGGNELRLYLSAGGALGPTGSSTGDDPGETRYDFDPASPVPTIGGGISAADEVMVAGGFDQRLDSRFVGAGDELPLSSRRDVVSFQTEPLLDPVAVAGPVRVALWVSSSATDTDFTAKLLDVYPPGPDHPRGFALNLCDSIVRARYRSDRAVAELMVPGEIYAVSVTLYPTANLFAVGHRIRLDVSSSNFPRFDVNPNTGESLAVGRSRNVARNTVHHDAEHPSHLALWVVPELATPFEGARGGAVRSLSSVHAPVHRGSEVGSRPRLRPAELVMENQT